MVKVLFVCLGNICRSPMAEGLFLHLVKEAGLEASISVESCGTGGWHVGERPDPRMREIASQHGVALPSRARQIRESDFVEFDYILAMDESNLRSLQRIASRVPEARAQLYKMRYFDEEAPHADVPDPYYGGQGGFQEVFDMLKRASQQLLDHIRAEQVL